MNEKKKGFCFLVREEWNVPFLHQKLFEYLKIFRWLKWCTCKYTHRHTQTRSKHNKQLVSQNTYRATDKKHAILFSFSIIL